MPVAVRAWGALRGKWLTRISVGQDFACALDRAGAAFCWGKNGNGRLGDASIAGSDTPVAVSTRGVLKGKRPVAIAAGGYHTCVIDSRGVAFCWGFNVHGQLGIGSTANSILPARVSTRGALAGRVLTGIAAGGYETCAMSRRGAVFCWGANGAGELGDGARGGSTVAVRVRALR